MGIETKKIQIDFTDYPEVWEWLVKAAHNETRTIRLQIVKELKNIIEGNYEWVGR